MEFPSPSPSSESPSPPPESPSSESPSPPPESPSSESPSPPPESPSSESPSPPPESPSSESPSPPSVKPPRVKRRFSALFVVGVLLVGLVAGSLICYAASYSLFNGKLAYLESAQSNPLNVTYLNGTYYLDGNVSLSAVYGQVQQSVVVIRDLLPEYTFFGTEYEELQGSGFVTTVDNQQVIVTNNHVVEGTTNITVTFADGSSYIANEIGSDSLADLAVLTVSSMPSGIPSLTLASSTTLQVGDPVIAIGSPYGLSGTLTTGVISALDRTITEESSESGATGPTIPDMIQTSTAINPGNSGGPLVNYAGDVVGITTAAVSDSEGLGFAIPSSTIIRELYSLVTTGTYDEHPTIDTSGVDMDYAIAQAMGTNVTYGYLVESVSTQNGLDGGNTQTTIEGSTVVIGGDIIIAINGTKIINTDSLLAYLEENTLPGQTMNFTVIRDGATQTVSVTIGKLS